MLVSVSRVSSIMSSICGDWSALSSDFLYIANWSRVPSGKQLLAQLPNVILGALHGADIIVESTRYIHNGNGKTDYRNGVCHDGNM